MFLAASVLLFGTSGIYHRGTWSARGEAVLRRLDHANIYVFIAASYTPLALLLLDRAVPRAAAEPDLGRGPGRAAASGCSGCPRRAGSTPRSTWLMGWAALGWMGAFYAAAGRRCCPDPGRRALLHRRRGGLRPQAARPVAAWFGFHEIFHACTIAGFVCHYVAISMITYAV